MRRTFIAALLFATAAPAALHSAAAPATPTYVTKAVADPTRPADQRERDAVRLPTETIVFAGVKPGMTVAEFVPGSGYYTRMLADVVGPKGHVYTMENDKWVGAIKPDDPLATGGKLKNVTMTAAPFGTVKFPKPLDVAWIVQNYHDMKIAKYGTVDTLAFDRAVFAALKPGGTFFILDHDAAPGTDVSAIEKLHRIEKAQVIREVTAAGFKLAGEGTFLRHPSDDRTLSIFDDAIKGKTDQYALKFVKPR